MTEPSDLARSVLARYRSSISPSTSERDVLVDSVARRIGGGSSSAGASGAVRSGGGAPWLVVVGIAIVIAGGAWWSARTDAVARVEPAFAGAVAPIELSPPAPVIASAAVAHDGAPVAPSIASPPATLEPATREPAVRTRGARPAARPSHAVGQDAAPATAPALVDEEVRLLREANLALREGREAVARARFDEHARRFPDGALVELREVGRARMRCRAATADEAAEIVARFGREFPGSPHLARLERECPDTSAR